MRSVGLEELRNDLGAYVRAAEAGETLLVTEDERVVAELVPPRSAYAKRPDPAWSRMTDEEFIAKGAREGWLTPATRRGPLPDPTYPPLLPPGELMEDLARDREDR